MNNNTSATLDVLESALDELCSRAEEVDDELLCACERIFNKTSFLRSSASKQWIDAGKWTQDPGIVSAPNALARVINISRPEAHALIKTAETLEEFPHLKELARDGSVSTNHVRSVSMANDEELSELLHENERFMIELAPRVDAQQFAKAMRRWKEYARAYTNTESAPGLFHGRRSFHLSPMLDGMYKLDATLEREEGLMLTQAIESISDSLYHSNARSQTGGVLTERDEEYLSPSQLRCDAFSVLISNSITEYGSERSVPLPLICVDVDYSQLCDRAGYNPLTSGESSADLDTATLLKLSCDAKIVRQITDGPTKVLEQGRSTRVVSPALRRFLHKRDQHCTFPGCDRPGNWCDAHHVVHWADGGPTNRDNLVLLCSHHHKFVHARNFTIEITSNGVTFTRGSRKNEGTQRAGP